jgi:hypothetical protein
VRDGALSKGRGSARKEDGKAGSDSHCDSNIRKFGRLVQRTFLTTDERQPRIEG